MRQERKFKNKFGELIYEDILHLIPDSEPSDCSSDTEARLLAKTLLQEALARAKVSISGDIKTAIAMTENVEPSPMFDARRARH